MRHTRSARTSASAGRRRGSSSPLFVPIPRPATAHAYEVEGSMKYHGGCPVAETIHRTRKIAGQVSTRVHEGQRSGQTLHGTKGNDEVGHGGVHGGSVVWYRERSRRTGVPARRSEGRVKRRPVAQKSGLDVSLPVGERILLLQARDSGTHIASETAAVLTLFVFSVSTHPTSLSTQVRHTPAPGCSFICG